MPAEDYAPWAMYNYQYPILNEIWRALRTVARIAAGVIGIIVAAELLRTGILLHRLHPLASAAFGAALAVLALWIGLRWHVARTEVRVLYPPTLPPPDRARHKDLKAYCKYLVLILKRLAGNESLSDELRRGARQRAYDIEGLLGAHPLNEDLMRAITRAENEVVVPLFADLDKEAIEIARYKMTAVVEDVIEPPFPVINPIVVLYHQATLVSCITDTYLGRPSLREYWTVLRDVWHVMSGGDFFRIGQRLFEGVYANSPPMGSATADLGQAISSIWLTWSVAQAAMHRCQSLREWTPNAAVRHLDQLTMDSLLITRDTLIRDVLPVLKLRIRHSVGPGTADAAGFSEQVVQGIAKAVDTIVQGLRTQPPERAAQISRRTQHGAARAGDGDDPPGAPPGLRRASDWKRRGVFRVFRTVRDRVHYSSRGKQLNG